MKQTISIIFILTFLIGNTYGQTDTGTVYRNLKTKKFYSVGLTFQSDIGKRTYEVNDNEVRKSTYRKYDKTWKNMEDCCPCILKSYDENNVLLKEAVSCTDCGVGYYKEFYANGYVKLSGRYKENPSKNWDSLWERGLCSVPDDQWIYFNEKGDTLYSEFWKNGEFVKQVPEQTNNEIWKVELTLNGEPVKDKTLTLEQVRQLVIKPRFKNNSMNENNFTIKFQISAIGYTQNEASFTIDSFKTIDVLKLLSEVGIPSGKQTLFNLIFYYNEKAIESIFLDIKL